MQSNKVSITKLVKQLPIGCGCFCPVFNDKGEIEDFVTIEINGIFSDLSKVESDKPAGKMVRSMYKGFDADQFEWMSKAARELIDNDGSSVTRIISVYNHPYKVTAFCPKDLLIFVVLEDVRAQVYQKYYSRSIPREVVYQSISMHSNYDGACAPQAESVPEHARSEDGRLNQSQCSGAVQFFPLSFTIDEELDAVFLDSLTGLFDRRYAIESLKILNIGEYMPLSIILGDVNGLKLTNEALGYDAGDQLLCDISGVFRENCRKNDLIARWGGDEFLMVLPQTSMEEAQCVVRRLRKAFAKKSKEDARISVSIGYTTTSEANCDTEQLLQVAEEWMLRNKLFSRESHRNNVINAILSMLYEKSTETREHSERMAGYCRIIAREMNMPDEQINGLVLLSMLHDIGKVGITHEILQKSGSLTPEERKEIERHPEIGYRITRNIPELAQVSEYILMHHEWWDGSGYPNGIRGEQIPLPCRIISVVDAYDVMITGRVYRPARCQNEVVDELRRCAGTQFDPCVVDVFVRLIECGASNK